VDSGAGAEKVAGENEAAECVRDSVKS